VLFELVECGEEFDRHCDRRLLSLLLHVPVKLTSQGGLKHHCFDFLLATVASNHLMAVLWPLAPAAVLEKGVVTIPPARLPAQCAAGGQSVLRSLVQIR
jgi:hypothetical protein